MAVSPYPYFDKFYDSSIHKKIEIIFIDGSGDTYTNDDIYAESLEITESICSESSLKFGLCESNCCKFVMRNPLKSHKNKFFQLYGTIDNDPATRYHVGTYYVVEDVATADKSKREITAYDELYTIVNSDVTDWWNNQVTFPCNLHQLRNSLLGRLGIIQETTVLPNDAMRIDKTIQPEHLTGGDVLRAICELNGCFPNMNRNRIMEYVFLPQDGELEALYPRNDLYPDDDLYPAGNSDILNMTKDMYITCQYSEYQTGRITQLQIRADKDDIGVIVDAKDIPSLTSVPEVLSRSVDANRYVVDDNFLCYGKSTDDLKQIAENLLIILAQVTRYVPYTCDCIGNPAFKVGKGLIISTKYQIVKSVVLKRTLRGIQSLRDTYEAAGVENYEEDVDSLNTSFSQLKGKTNRLLREIERLQSELSDLEEEASSVFEQTAELIQTTVKKGELSSQISQEAGEIRISANRFILDSTNLKISADGTLTAMAISGKAVNQFSDMINNSNAMYKANQAISDAKSAANDASNAASKAQTTADDLKTNIDNVYNTLKTHERWISELSSAFKAQHGYWPIT